MTPGLEPRPGPGLFPVSSPRPADTWLLAASAALKLLFIPFAIVRDSVTLLTKRERRGR